MEPLPWPRVSEPWASDPSFSVTVPVAELGETRKLVMASDLEPERKKELLHSLASREAVKAAIAEPAKHQLANDELAKDERRVTV